MQQRQDSGCVKSCEVVNIPGNPNRLFMRIIEDMFQNHFLKIQFCASNAGPMGDVIDNYKLKVHPDGCGCDIEIPISPSFYLLENATLLGDTELRKMVTPVVPLNMRMLSRPDLTMKMRSTIWLRNSQFPLDI
jgi:hypothetical protein